MIAWPTPDEACEAACLLCDHEDKKPSCCSDEDCAKACWILCGFCKAKEFACQGKMEAGGLPDRAALDSLAQKKMGAINWQALLAFVLQILSLLGPILTPPSPTPAKGKH